MNLSLFNSYHHRRHRRQLRRLLPFPVMKVCPSPCLSTPFPLLFSFSPVFLQIPSFTTVYPITMIILTYFPLEISEKAPKGSPTPNGPLSLNFLPFQLDFLSFTLYPSVTYSKTLI